MNITGYKVIYRNVLYKCLLVEQTPYPQKELEVGINKVEGMMGILVINEDGDLCRLYDEAWCFQFVKDKEK